MHDTLAKVLDFCENILEAFGMTWSPPTTQKNIKKTPEAPIQKKKKKTLVKGIYRSHALSNFYTVTWTQGNLVTVKKGTTLTAKIDPFESLVKKNFLFCLFSPLLVLF